MFELLIIIVKQKQKLASYNIIMTIVVEEFKFYTNYLKKKKIMMKLFEELKKLKCVGGRNYIYIS